MGQNGQLWKYDFKTLVHACVQKLLLKPIPITLFCTHNAGLIVTIDILITFHPVCENRIMGKPILSRMIPIEDDPIEDDPIEDDTLRIINLGKII